MSKLKNLPRYPLVWLSGAFLLGFTLADLLTPVKAFSDFENRYLKQQPSPTLKTVFDGSFAQNYEDYLNDQFLFRNGWITLKSYGESALLKVENNGIIYGRDGQLFEKYTSFSQAQLDKNLAYLQAFLEGRQAVVAVVPSAYEIYPEKLPLGLNQVDQLTQIAKINQALSDVALPLDLPAVLTAAKDQELYYRTDHHWTTDGAYLAYASYCAARDLTPVDREDLGLHRVPDFYGTYFNKCKNTSIRPDTLSWYDVPLASVTVDGQEKDGYLDRTALETRDKYGAFLWGNNGVTVLKSRETANPSRLLVIKDSFANCLAPFLTANYDEVWVVDLRSLPTGMTALMEETAFDDILILYNFENLAADTNFYRINR